VDVYQPLRRHFGSLPGQIGPWLDNHLDHHDPYISRRHFQDGQGEFGNRSSTAKCPEERCIHYIYGFATKADRERHVATHKPSLPADQESNLTPAFPNPLPVHRSSPRSDHPVPIQRPVISLQLPPPALPSSLPPIANSAQSGEQKDPFKDYRGVNPETRMTDA
jgi:hypothetical protein